MASTPPAARSSVDARAAAPLETGARTESPAARRSRPPSLLWLVFLANGSVLAIALLLLAFSPIEVDSPIEAGQFALLLAGFVVLVALNLVMLRRGRPATQSFSPRQ